MLYELTGHDDKQVSAWQNSLKNDGKYTVTPEILAKLKDVFYGGCCDDEQTKETIKKTYEKYSYTLDTHTAVAVKVYEDYKSATGDETRTIIASTASPYKFSASVLEAIDGKKPEIDEFAMVDRLYEISQYEIPDALASLKNKEIRFSESVESNQMKEFVLKTLGM